MESYTSGFFCLCASDSLMVSFGNFDFKNCIRPIPKLEGQNWIFGDGESRTT